MFDLGFSELLVVAVVALVVLGPERLPKAARFAGLWVRKARAQWYSVKSEFERELAADEMRRSIGDPARELRDQVDGLGRDLRDAGAHGASADDGHRGGKGQCLLAHAQAPVKRGARLSRKALTPST